MADVVVLESAVWGDVLTRLGAVEARSVVVLGPAAPQVADALRAAGGPTPVLVGDDVPGNVPDTDGEGIAPGAVDMVILLGGWRDRRRLGTAARIARAWLGDNGLLLLGDLHARRLVSSVPSQYPAALLYRSYPDVAADLVRRCAAPAELEATMIRTGMADKRVEAFDRPVGVFADAVQQRTAAASGLWRGLEMLPPDDRAALLDTVSARGRLRWPLVETEPWVVAAGRKRP